MLSIVSHKWKPRGFANYSALSFFYFCLYKNRFKIKDMCTDTDSFACFFFAIAGQNNYYDEVNNNYGS